MADLSFDVVIIGGGNKGLVTAMYLTKYGKMNVGIFEDRHELGGGWCQEEPVPGFIANPCSMDHASFYHIPVYWDFPEWETYGAKYAYTEITTGCIFIEDDSCLLQYAAFDDVDPTQERTAKEIARFSEKDAETYLKLWEKSEKYWDPAIREWMFTPAKPFSEPDALDKLIQNPDSGIDPAWLYMSPLQVYHDVFEDPHLRHAFARINQSLAIQNDMAAAGLMALMMIFQFWPRSCWVKGSSHSLAHAAHRIILENGGKVFTNCEVKKILLENGRAKGIRLADGSEVEAKKAVVTSLDPYQVCFELLGKENVDYRIANRIKNLERDWVALMWYTWALKERPHFKAESWNPDVWKSMWVALGDMDVSTFKVESSERKMYKWPSKLNLGYAYHGATIIDSGDHLIAPPEINFTILTEQFVVPAWSLSDEEWKVKEKQHAEEVIELFKKYAPNMSWNNVIGYLPVTPRYTANMAKNYAPAGNWCIIDNIPSQSGRMRPIPELAGNRWPGIKGLYCTGSAWHPYGCAHSPQAYNCYKVMAEDFGLIKTWEKEGRPF